MPPIFPFEIEEIILDLLAEDDEDHLELKTCSLVCQNFLTICRKHIFESIVLNPSQYHRDYLALVHSQASSLTTHKFDQLLRETPEIAGYIRKLDYTIRSTDLTSASIQESLRRISRLEFLTIRCGEFMVKLDWSSPIRPTLLYLLHLPTLTHFEMNEVVEVFAVSDLIPCVNLKFLNIGCTSMAVEDTFPSTLPKHSIQLNEFVAQSQFGVSASAIMKLCTTRRPDGQPIINFGSLSKIKVVFLLPDAVSALQELFRHCHVLTNASILCK